MRIREPWPPPVLRRVVFLPEQPDFARVVGQQVLSGKAHCHGEPLRALTHQHHVASVGHNFFRHLRDIDNVPHRSNRAGTPRRPVHATGIEFNHTFFVGQAAEADAGVIRIILWTFNHLERRIERIPSSGEKRVGVVEISQAIVGGYNDGTFTGGNSLILLRFLPVAFEIENPRDSEPATAVPRKSRREIVISPPGECLVKRAPEYHAGMFDTISCQSCQQARTLFGKPAVHAHRSGSGSPQQRSAVRFVPSPG